MPTRGFSASDRLRKRAEFLRVQRRGVRSQSPHFVLYALAAPDFDRPRLGISVSRQIGKAVIRNRLKRRIRECFRLRLRDLLDAPAALVIIARPGSGSLDTPTINAELAAATLNLNQRLKGG